MKKQTLKLLTLFMSFQMVFGPVAYAQTDSYTPSKFEKTISDIHGGLEAITQSGIFQPQPVNLFQPASQGITLFETHPTLANLGCEIPMATLQQQDYQCGSAQGAHGYQQYQYIADEFDLYLTKGNSSGSQGLRCLENAVNSFHRDLKKRLEDFDLFSKQMLDLIELNAKRMERDYERLYQADALLNGSSGKVSKIDFDKNDFLKGFQSPACKSYLQDENLLKMGEGGGLKSIAEDLSKQFEESSAKQGHFSAKSFLEKGQNIENQINDMANRFSKNIDRKKSQGYTSKDLIGGYKGSVVSQGSQAINNVIETLLTDYDTNIVSQQDELHHLSAEDFANIDKSPKRNANELIRDHRRQSKNACLNSYIGNLDSFLSNIYDPRVSKRSQKEAKSLYKRKIQEALSDPTLDPAQKLEIMAASENKSLRIKINNPQEIGSGNTFVTPKKYIQHYKKECDRQYKASERSGLAKEEQIKKYAQVLKDQKNKLKESIKSQIYEKVISCPDQGNTGTSSLSCSNDAFDSNAGTFCVRVAKTCAQNMNKCNQSTGALIQKVEADQDAIKASLVNQHNNILTGIKGMIENIKSQDKNASNSLHFGSRTASFFDGDGMSDENSQNTSTDFLSSLSEDMLEGFVDPSTRVPDIKRTKEKIKEKLKLARADISKDNASLLGLSNGNFPEEAPVRSSDSYGGAGATGLIAEINNVIQNAQKEKAKYEQLSQACKGAFDGFVKAENEKFQKAQEAHNDQLAKCNAAIQCQQLLAGPHKDDLNTIGNLTNDVMATMSDGKTNPINTLCKDYTKKLEEFVNDEQANLGSKLNSICESAKKDDIPSCFDSNKNIITFCDMEDKEDTKNDISKTTYCAYKQQNITHVKEGKCKEYKYHKGENGSEITVDNYVEIAQAPLGSLIEMSQNNKEVQKKVQTLMKGSNITEDKTACTSSFNASDELKEIVFSQGTSYEYGLIKNEYMNCNQINANQITNKDTSTGSVFEGLLQGLGTQGLQQ